MYLEQMLRDHAFYVLLPDRLRFLEKRVGELVAGGGRTGGVERMSSRVSETSLGAGPTVGASGGGSSRGLLRVADQLSRAGA